MGNKILLGSKRVKVGDKKYHLVVNMNVLAALEEATGRNSFEHDFFPSLMATPVGLRLLLWAMMVQQDKTLTIENVGELMHLGNTEDIEKVISTVLQSSLPDQDKLDDSAGDKDSKKARGPKSPKAHQPLTKS